MGDDFAGHTLETLHDEPLLPAPLFGHEEGWKDRTALLSKKMGEIEYTTVHTLKGTPLAWCAKGAWSPPDDAALAGASRDRQELYRCLRERCPSCTTA